MHLKTVFSLVVPALAFLGTVAGAPSTQYSSYEADFNDTSLALNHGSLDARQNARPALRIMPLGASIVTGVGSSTGNGFRKPLRDQLRFKGWLVNMVGSKQNGNMVDRNFEATSGFTIDQVRNAARNSYGYKANVVLMNVGTNDANQGLVSGAGSRMEALLNDLWGADGMSKTYVVISSVLRRNDAKAESNRKQINEQYKELINRLRSSGKPINYVDIDIPLNELTDGIHPNDAGHKKMAIKFWHAIEWGHQQGLIAEAPPMTQAVGNTCDKVAGQAQYGGITQKGSGDDDGIYYHNSQEMGSIWSYTSEFDRDQWFFTRLYGTKYDDIVGWWYADKVLTFATWKNIGGGKFSKVSDLKTDLFCNPRGIWWVDINGDGYDDFLCVSPNGDTLASINNRDGTASKPPTFNNIGMIKTNVGYAQDRVRWGDIDGDGRADYMILDNGGNVRAWRNSGTGNKPSWQPLGLRFTAKNMGDMRGVRFEDINGDGRDDWLWVDNHGQTTTWTNSRSCKKGKMGDGLNVAWRQGFWNGASSGPTHAGVGASNRTRIHFARIYGEASFGLLPKADYVYLQMTKQKDGRFKFDMKVWKNTGHGSTKLKADGNKYCNMHGHADGRQDYVWTLSTGKMKVWPNLGKKSSNSEKDVFWGSPKEMWNPGRDLDRRDLHLVDWNDDGACDIAWVDPNNNNRVSVWLNNYKKTGSFTWTYLANPAPVLNCPEKRGVGIHDLPVRFADVSNNKLSDYICIQPDGRFHGWTHNSDGSWERIAQFKKAEGIDRANIRFGNVNGRGGEDMIWVDKYTGDATVYINRGKMDTGGSNWWFLKSGKQYDGSWAGTCQYFPDLDGDNRADLHSIMGSFTNRGETFFNRCGLMDLEGDDAGWAPGQDPGFGPLPSPPSQGNDDDDDDDDGTIDLPQKGVEDICGHNFGSEDIEVIRKSWKESGAADWWKDFIMKTKASDWSNKFFQQVMADGTQGGSTYDCTRFTIGNCPGPGNKACSTYNPPEAFYMHIQIGNVFNSFEKLWMTTVENAIEDLSTGIKTIVDAFGTPPPEDNVSFLNMLVGILTSLAGFGAVAPLVAGPATAFAGIFTSLGAGMDWEEEVSSATLNDKLENAYGQMFKKVMDTSQNFVESLFRGEQIDGVDKDATEWVYDFFKDANWLSKNITNPAIDQYIYQAHKKWDEFAVVKAMKSGNKADFYLMVSDEETQCSKGSSGVGSIPSLVDMTEDICKNKMDSCIWHDKHCLCFGSRPNKVPSVSTSVHALSGDDLKNLKGYVFDWEAALRNNYDCGKYYIDNQKTCLRANKKPDECKIQDAQVPDGRDLDLKSPLQYSKCWFNLQPMVGDRFACGWRD